MSRNRHIEIVEESDRRWPNFSDIVSHQESGGFVDGAKFADANPTVDWSDDLPLKVYPTETDPIAETVAAGWRRGFRPGFVWAKAHPLTEK